MKKKYRFRARSRPNKLLGQHFLRSKRTLEYIVKSAKLSPKDVVLEVGPGRGALTEVLGRSAKKVIAVEKDRRLVEELAKNFSGTNVEIITGDILNIDHDLFPKKYKTVANLPYYLTGNFLRRFLDSKNPPLSMTLMVQHEVARRILAKPPHMNLLALSVQAFGTPTYIARVSKKEFRPEPKVDSAIITIDGIGDSYFTKNNLNKKRFFEVIKKAFSQKRKKLRNSIGPLAGRFSDKRPEALSLHEWARVVTKIDR